MDPLARDQFETLVGEVFDTFPTDIAHFFDNVAILIADRPTRTQQRAADRGLLLGLYEGVPRIEREGHNAFYPDRITLFQGALIAVSPTAVALRRNVAVTLWHEIGHHLGFPDAKLHQIERRILRHVRVSGRASQPS
ncbi:MAG: metallopeptidase family protein [Candidatus Kerfeldbacteria bacterium]|nr:metallopeptidase family protein [Candidatus Kerfeldbacteria bacterium]